MSDSVVRKTAVNKKDKKSCSPGQLTNKLVKKKIYIYIYICKYIVYRCFREIQSREREWDILEWG